MTRTIIAWDLGATKCAAGLVEYDVNQDSIQCKKRCTVKLSDTTSLEDLIAQLESGLGSLMTEADAICIGAAGFYDGTSLLLEPGYPYPMPFAKTAKQFKWPSHAVVHDYTPIICATFTSYMENTANLKRINRAEMNPYGRRVAMGIGTGLGMKDGILLSNGEFWLGQNEIGHIGITTPPRADLIQQKRHLEFIQFLQSEHVLKHNEPLTFEKILSGQGTVRLHQFLYPENHSNLTPEIIGEKMRQHQAPELMEMFAWYLGLFIGTVQLIFMPEGGIWLTGGVALHHLEAFDLPALMEGIQSSPSYLSQREHYPLGILCNQEHALMGGGYYAAKRLL